MLANCFYAVTSRIYLPPFLQFPNGMWADAKRHPISSWRQHYKMNQGRLDLIVNELVRKKGLNPWSRTAYTADRRRNTGTFAVKVRRIQTGEDEEDEVEAEICLSGDEDLSEDLDYSSTHARPAKRPRTVNPRRFIQCKLSLSMALMFSLKAREHVSGSRSVWRATQSICAASGPPSCGTTAYSQSFWRAAQPICFAYGQSSQGTKAHCRYYT